MRVKKKNRINCILLIFNIFFAKAKIKAVTKPLSETRSNTAVQTKMRNHLPIYVNYMPHRDV
jgi:hypothetical protein